MPPNNSPLRRAERRAAAAERNARPCVCCRACGRRHAVTRGCWGPITYVPTCVDTNSRGFLHVLRDLGRRATHWIRRHR